MKPIRFNHPPAFTLEPLEQRVLMSAAPITFTDGDGTDVTIRLTGNGAMQVVINGQGTDLQVTGADRGTSITIATKGGDGRTQLNNIDISGAIKSITAKTTDLLGDLTISGSVSNVTIGDFTGGGAHLFSIGGTLDASAANLTLGRILDLSINSGTPLKKLSVTDWDDSGNDDLITAPTISSIKSREDFAAGATVSDDEAKGSTLGKVNVDDALSGTWSVEGNADSFIAGSVGPGFSANITELLKKINTKDDFAGVLAANEITTVSIGGDLDHARILAGADLGDDAKLGGVGADVDLFSRGQLGKVNVKGGSIDSVVSAGLDPVDGVFGNGDDFVTGKTRSSVKGLSIRGIADAQTVFAGGKFPKKVKVGNTSIEPAGDPRFVLASTDDDEDPPVIIADLQNDTGTDGDNITSDPSIVGRVTDLGKIESFRLGIDDEDLSDFNSVLGEIESNGTFEIIRSRIEQINGGPLTVGVHTINLVAKDDAGNSSAVFIIPLVFNPNA